MPQQGMGQMIQMITALAEMQDRRKRLALDQQQFEAQRDQFAQTLGFQKDDERWKKATKLLDVIGEGGATAAVAVHDLAPLAGFSQQEAEAFAHVAPSAQTALQRIQANQGQFNLDQQQAGLASMGTPNPTPQQGAQQAAYLNQQAGGPNAMGQLGAGNLIAQMAGQAQNQITPGAPDFNAEMAKRVAQGFLIRTGTNQDPWSFAVGQAGINAGLAPAAASIAAGATPSAGQQLQAQSEEGRIMADIIGHRASANATDLKDSSDVIAQMRTTAEAVANKNYADKNTRDHLIKQYNAYARLLQSHGVQVDLMDAEGTNAGEAVGRITGWLKGMTGTNAPPSLPMNIPGGIGGGMGGGGTGPRPPGGF